MAEAMVQKDNGKNDPEMYNKGWDTIEDFQRDLILFADFEQPDDKKPKASTPESIRRFHEKMKNNKRSIYTDSGIDESKTYFISGRGKGVIDRVVRPGQSVTPLPSDDEELRRQIRQVSGLGYSNALIEESIRANYVDRPNTNTVDWSKWEAVPRFKHAAPISKRKSPSTIPEQPSCSTSEHSLRPQSSASAKPHKTDLPKDDKK